jgi:O-antigen ligase
MLFCGFRWFGWRGTALAIGGAAAIGALAWMVSPFLQHRVVTLATEVQNYREANRNTSAGERLEFWKKSIGFVAAAPIIGHGTGSIKGQFRNVAVGATGASAVVSANPHNQTLAVAIQLGLVGTAVLFALWISHLLLFRNNALAAWIGLVVVVQNLVGSLFNSQLFDFTHGWAYVIGVGVCGGVMMGRGARRARQ